MKDKLNECNDLIQQMKAAPEAPVPELFTERVMSRVLELDQSIWARVKHSLRNSSWKSIRTRLEPMLSVSSRKECSFCFFITGYFYLIMGIVLIAGLGASGSSMATMGWIELQPHFIIGVAIWLLALGMVLMMKGNSAIRIVKYGAWFYILFTIINGILMWNNRHIPYTWALFMGLVGTNVIIGFLLALAVKKMELRMI